jgi:dipeptidyl aminopeptidase/acylaminoacyl peptidase
MTRNRWCLVVSACLLTATAGFAASRVETGELILENIRGASTPPDILDSYLAARQAYPLGWAPKGQLLIATRFGDVDQLHLVEKPGGERLQITFQRDPIRRAAFSPDPSHAAFFYLKDANGDEHAQLYYQRSGEPVAKLLTDGKSANGPALWSNSGTARTGIDTDIDVVEPATAALPHLAVTGDSARWYTLDWSPDDSKLLVLKSVSRSEAHLYVVELSSGQKREIEATSGKAGIRTAKFSRDGQGVYVISDRDSDYARLRYVNLFTGEKTTISPSIVGDIDELAVSRDGHYLAFVGNEGGVSKLNVQDLRSHQDLTPPKFAAPGVIGSLSFDAEGKRLAMGYSSATAPSDAYVLDVESNHLEAWTHSEAGAADALKPVTPRLAQFPTFDRQDGGIRQEPVYVYEPVRPGPHPVLITLESAPESQFRPTFDPWIAYVVNELGFAVVAPNLRGSSGYGKAYANLGNGMLRDDVVKDLGALIIWVDSQSGLDSKHVIVAGRAYGGYLALAALANYGDRLRGGVDAGGISDFITFLEGTAPYRQAQERAEYGDERSIDTRAYLRRISPLTNTDRISKPLLVMHGRNDARIPIAQSEQIINRLRSRNVDVWSVEAKDEGYDWRRQRNREAYYHVFSSFLVEALREDSQGLRAEPTGPGRPHP